MQSINMCNTFSAPCGPTVFNATSSVQYIQSPNYPLNYDANVRCTWTINGARFFDEVDITFLDMDIEASPDCQKDRLEIRDLPSSVRDFCITLSTCKETLNYVFIFPN